MAAINKKKDSKILSELSEQYNVERWIVRMVAIIAKFDINKMRDILNIIAYEYYNNSKDEEKTNKEDA